MSRGRAGGVAWVVCPPPWWCCVQGACAVPCFCSGLFRSGGWSLWSLCILLSRICPNCACTQLFLIPYSFFVFCRSRRRLSRCENCGTAAEGPRSQPVSFPARDSTPLFLRGKGLKVSSSETLPPGWAADPSVF